MRPSIRRVFVGAALLAASSAASPLSVAAEAEAPPGATVNQQSSDTVGVTFETRNGPRTLDQLRDELPTAGYPGPWDAASVQAAYASAGPAGIPPYPNDTSWTCLPTNPSCGKDPWWAE